MLLNLIAFTLIILITMYLATQGMLSSLIALVTAVFASILAMGLMESLQWIVANNLKSDYARGVTFLLLFFLGFSACRIIGDIVVPKNIKLPQMVNRIAGGFAGFFCAMVVVGTTIIGIEMLPLSETIIGFNRFPDGMQAQNSDGKPSPGTVAKPAGVWFAPDRFVIAIWDGVSGRALGGSRPWSEVHPDLSTESYGYRHSVQLGSRHTLYPELLEVTAAWTSLDPSKIKKIDALDPVPDTRLVMVRTAIRKATGKDRTSADPDDEWFRITPNEVRLLAHTTGPSPKYLQYYPIGFLRMKRTANSKGEVNPKAGNYIYEPLDLNSGQLVDDYAQVKGDSVINYDWVFRIPSDQSPEQIEVKQLARTGIAGLIKDIDAESDNKKAVAILEPLKPEQYPLREYETRVTTFEVTLNTEGKLIPQGKVYIMENSMSKSKMDSAINAAAGRLETIIKEVDGGGGGWNPAMSSFYRTQYSQAVKIQPDKDVSPGVIVPMLIAAQMKADPRQNMQNLPNYIKQDLEPLLGNAVVTSAEIKNGVATLEKIPTRKFTVFAWGRADTGLWVWITEVTLTKDPRKDTFTTETSPAIRVELNK